MSALANPEGPVTEEDQSLLETEGLPVSEEDWRKFRAEAVQQLPNALKGKSLPDILLGYQKKLLSSTSHYSLTVTDKSRRIGATWAIGADAVLTAGAARNAGGMDVLYIGYNVDMAREFIDACGMWARAFMPACSEVGEFLFVDKGDGQKPDQEIKAFRITFASGFEIVALSSRPRSLRGRQGYAILDEFAFHDEADGLLKAAMAFLIWGGKVLVISTHNGADNAFNVLIEEVRAGKYGEDANVVRCTFDDALEQGLYERICLTKGKEWTAEGEAKWRANIRQLYRANAAEELDCVPNQGSGVYLSRALIEACNYPEDTVETLVCPPGFELRPPHIRESYVEAWLEQNVAPHIARLDPNLRHCFGQDFARSGDASVYVPIAIEKMLTKRVPFVVEMRNVPYEQQKQIVIWITERLPRFSGGQIDSRGNGEYLGEVVMQEFGQTMIEQVKATQAWYAENMPRMKADIEDRTISYPANDNVNSDLRMVQLVRGIPKVPEDASETGTDGLKRHGDFAIALCLAEAATRMDVAEYEYRGVRGDGKATGGPKRGEEGWEHPDDIRSGTGRGRRFGKGGAW